MKAQAQLRVNVADTDWLTKEQAFGIKQQIKQLRTEIKEYENTIALRIRRLRT